MKTYDDYKPSRIDWVGNIPAHWKTKKLKYLVDLVDEPAESDSFIVAVENIESKTGKLINLEEKKEFQSGVCGFRQGDILFNKLRPYLAKVYYAEKDGGCIGELLILRTREEIHNKFLYYCVLSSAFIDIVDSSTNGAKMPRANWDGFINQLLIPYPSDKTEQAAIFDYLDERSTRIDKLIASKQELIDLLREERLTVINSAVTQGINTKTKLKPSGISWLGDIPAHWEIKKLKYLLSKVIDNRGKTPPFGTTGIPMLEVRNITEGYKAPTDNFEKYVEPEIVSQYERDKVQIGDLLISTVGATSGKIVIIETEPNYFIAQNVVGLRTIKSVNNLFFYYLLSSDYFFTSLRIINKSNTIDNLKVSIFINNFCLLPPLEEQQQIVDFIEAETGKIDATISKIQNEIDLIREYRTALISEVVTGKIKVV